MNTKTKVFSIALTGLLAFSLSACGAKSNSDKTANGTDSNKPAGTVTEIVFSNWANSGEIASHTKAVEKFNADNPDVKVIYQPAPGDGYEEALITSLAGGTGADVFYAGDATIIKLIKNQSVVNLQPFMESAESPIKPTDIPDGLWGAAKNEEGIYGINVDCNPVVLYYSPKKFAELGIKDPREYFDAGEWNYANFESTLNQLKEKGLMGFIFNKEPMYTYNFAINNGGQVWRNGKFDPDEKAIEGFEFVAQGVKNGTMTYASALPKGQGADASFISGKVGFVQAGRWWTPSFVDAKVDFDYIPLPVNEGDKYGKSFVPTAYISVSAKSKNIEAAQRFVTFYTSKEGQSIRLSGVGNAIPSVAGIDALVTDSKIPAHVEDIFKVRESGWSLGTEIAPDAAYPGLQDALISQLEEIYINGKDVKTAIEKMKSLADEYQNR